MIVKERSIPVHIHKLEALLRRLSNTHHKRSKIEEDLGKRLAGYKGEQRIDYPLSFLPEKDYSILHDVRLFDGSHYFQMDTIILSNCFILILEVKNIAGSLYFDSDFNQLIRTLNEKEEPFPDPISQVERQQYQLLRWLRIQKFNHIPIETLVVISSSNAILTTSPNNRKVYEKVILSSKLPAQINKFLKIHPQSAMDEKTLAKLTKKIVKCHTPQTKDILNQFSISKNELIKGVLCTGCRLTMNRERGKWVCTTCHHRSNEAHIESLLDYSLLISPIITNREARGFLNITSSEISKNLLKSLNLPFTGNNKSRSYNLSSLQKKHPPTKRMQK